MKRILTLLILSFLFYQAQSQILFSQDFESGSLDPMTAIDVDGKTLDSNLPGYLGPTWTVFQSTASNKMIASTSWFTPVGVANDWLISDSIVVTEPNTFLIWDSYTQDPNFRDGYEVRLSTTDKAVASFTNVLFTIPAELTTTQTRTVKLDAFIGQTIYFAFRNNSNDKFILFLDNIRVEVLKDVDAIVSKVSFEKYQPVFSVVPITVTVENHGALPLTSLVFSYTDGINTYTDSIDGLNIAPLKTVELTHNVNYDLSEVGEFQLDIDVSNPNGVDDGNPENNSQSKLVYSLEVQVPKKVVVEEATGTWCIWCPRGAVFMDRVAEQFAEIALPIAVHNFDPMVVPEYDGPFSQSVGGYPSGHVDRKVLDTDPQTFLTAIQSVQNRRVPVAVDVTAEFDELTRTVTIKGIGHLTIATSANDLRFGAVITEDSVTGTTIDYAQANIYAGGAQGVMGGYETLPNPVPANQMVYDYVARALLGGYYGLENSIPNAVEADEEFEVEFSYVIPAGFNEERMNVILYVLDEETGEMLNGDMVGVTEGTVSTPLVPLGKSALYPNPTSDVLNLTVDFQTTNPVSMKIYDTYGRLITNLGNLDLSAGSRVEKIDVSDMPTGNYILELRHKNSVTALPFTRI